MVDLFKQFVTVLVRKAKYDNEERRERARERCISCAHHNYADVTH